MSPCTTRIKSPSGPSPPMGHLPTVRLPSVSPSARSRIKARGEGGTMRALIALSLVALPVGVPQAIAHGGGLNAEGCHNNRQTGDYHCHRGGGGGGGSSTPRSSPRQTRPSVTPAGGGGVFRNCTEARAAGAAPVYAGSPGYGPHLDRDGDGVGCEPYKGR